MSTHTASGGGQSPVCPELQQVYAEFRTLIADQERAARRESEARERLEERDAKRTAGCGDDAEYQKAFEGWRRAWRNLTSINGHILQNHRRRGELLRLQRSA
jgi:hypothetical protein